MIVETSISETEAHTWECLKTSEDLENNSVHFNLVKITGNGKTVYGYIIEGSSSLTIPVFSGTVRFNKARLAELNQSLLEEKDKRFSAEEFCKDLGFHETASPESPTNALIIGKYSIGHVNAWSEVGILIKLGKHLECKPAELARLISSELNLEIEPIGLKYLEKI